MRAALNWPEEKRETLELNVDDKRLMELLGIEVGEVNVQGKNALKVDTVFACIRILSESIAKLPLKVYQEDENGIQKATRHPIYQLLKLRPNPHMSALDFWKTVETQRSLYGNAYVNIEFDRQGKIVALWPIDSTRVKVVIDDTESMPIVTSIKRKIWYEVDTGADGKRKIMPDEMLHFKGSITLNGLVGIAPLDYLRSTIENAASSNKFINNFFRQGLQTKGIVQYVGDLNPTAQETFRKNFESMSSGLKNSHRISLMPIGYKFEPIALTMVDAQFLENTQLTIRQIATSFGVKMHQLGDMSRATHHNTAEQQKEFYTETLQPPLTGYEQEMTWKLFLDQELASGLYIKFNVDALLRADIKTRYEAYRIGIQGMFLTPDEVRAMEERPPLPGGDRLYANGSVVPLTEAGAAYRKGGDGAGQGEEDTGEGNSSAADDD